jgi:hypothetical protein
MECHTEPGKPPMKSNGAESVRSLDGLWIVAECACTVLGKPTPNVLTLGYDSEQKKYVGTWVGSCTTHLWQYEG